MAGGASETQYPWGFTNPGTSNDFAIYGDGAGNCYYPNPEGGVGAPCVGWENFAPVGTAQLGAGTWGQLDLSGSLFEWTLDWYLSYETPCVDCANLTYACQGGCGSASADRAMRGGAFNWDSTYLVPTNRFHYNPWNIWYAIGVGFRCARVP
jgi:formylglycine-generating enzyme required for sulfatase activity